MSTGERFRPKHVPKFDDELKLMTIEKNISMVYANNSLSASCGGIFAASNFVVSMIWSYTGLSILWFLLFLNSSGYSFMVNNVLKSLVKEMYLQNNGDKVKLKFVSGIEMVADISTIKPIPTPSRLDMLDPQKTMRMVQINEIMNAVIHMPKNDDSNQYYSIIDAIAEGKPIDLSEGKTKPLLI